MNDAVISLCQCLWLYSCHLPALCCDQRCVCVCVCVCVRACVPFSWGWVTGTQGFRNCEFIPEGPQRSFWDTRKWWNSPLRRCERAKQRKERKDTSWSLHQKPPLLFLMAICGLLLITKQLTSFHRHRASGWISGLWLCTVILMPLV